MPSIRITLPILALLLSTHATAQRRGVLQAHANSISLSDAPGGDNVRYKPAGDQTQPSNSIGPFPVSYTGPKFTLFEMFGPNAHLFEIDAISTGNDLVPINTNGEIVLQDRWGIIVFSVDKSATGLPGGWIADRVQQSGLNNVGADLGSLVLESFPTSGNPPPIPTALQGQPFLEQRAEHMGRSSAAEIDALDWFIPLITMATGAGTGASPIFVNLYTVFFSVTTESAEDLEAANAFPAGITPHGASIYKMTWNQNNNTWGDIEEEHTPASLGLERDTIDEKYDIDALAVNTSAPTGSTFIFSMRKTVALPPYDQLLAFGPSYSKPLPLKRNTSGDEVQVAARIDENDEIDALCIVEPELGVYNTWLSTPLSGGTPTTIGLSLTRAEAIPGSGNPTTGVFQISGWDGLTPSDSQVRLFVRELGSTALQTPLPPLTRLANQDTFEFASPLPVPPAGISGGDYEFAVMVSNDYGTRLTGTHVIRL